MGMLDMLDFSERIKRDFAKLAPGAPMLFGYKIFSQNDEDGIIAHLIATIARHMPLTHTFIEFGTGPGLENNTHALLLQGFSGCWIDATDYSQIRKLVEAARFPRLFLQNMMVNLDNIDGILDNCVSFLGTENIDFFSMDLDYNDWYFVKEALEKIKPKIICVEYNAKFPPPLDLKVAYSAKGTWQLDDYQGASLQAFVNLLADYRLVACSLAGVNAFFVHNSLAFLFPEYSVDTLYQPARYEFGTLKPGHKPSFSWLADALANAELSEPHAVLAAPPQKRAIPFVVHAIKDIYVSECIRKYGRWETFESILYENILEKDDFFLDLGANIGWFTILASMCIGNGGKVRAIEPGQLNFQILQRNIKTITELTGHDVTASKLAVSDSNGEGILYLSADNLGDHRIYPDQNGRNCEIIRLLTLESLLSCEEHLPDVIKMDTQGAEMAILAGGDILFKNGWRPIWIFEFAVNLLFGGGHDPFALLVRFNELGYDLYQLRGDVRKLRQIRLQEPQDPIHKRLRERTNDGGIDILAIMPDSPRLRKLNAFFDD